MLFRSTSVDPRPKLPFVRCPTLVLSAGKDPMSAAAETIHKLTPDSKLNIIKDGPIDLNRVWPREFAEAVLEFLNSTPG